MEEEATEPMAKGRIIFWSVSALIILFLIVILLPSLGTLHPPRTEAMSYANMRQILIGCTIYAVDHDGHWPQSFHAVLSNYPEIVSEDGPSIFENPREGYLTYQLAPLPVRLNEVKDPSTTPVLYEVKLDGTIDRDGCIGYADGHVEGPRDRSAQ